MESKFSDQFIERWQLRRQAGFSHVLLNLPPGNFLLVAEVADAFLSGKDF